MRFVINWSTPNVGMDLEYTKAVVDSINHGTPMDEFEGFKILERVFFPSGRPWLQARRSPQHVARVSVHRPMPWTKAFGITVEVIPALSDEEFVNAEAKIGSAQG